MTTTTNPDPASLDVALADVRRLLDRRTYLERELTLCEMELKDTWKRVPHMPVRTHAEIELEGLVNEQRDTRMLRAAHGDRAVANILKDLFHG